MQIAKSFFPVTTLGPGQRLAIWTLGCRRMCPGCSNPELWASDVRADMPVSHILKQVEELRPQGVTISGGEPFLQAAELKELVCGLHRMGIEDILIYTGFLKEELLDMEDPDVDFVLTSIAVLVDGPFIKELADDVPLRGSSNQRVWALNPKYERAYGDFMNGEKRVDAFFLDGEVHYIGIPDKNYQTPYEKRKKEKL